MDGWIKLYRKLLDNPIFEDPIRLAIWIYLLLSATHGSRDVMIGDQRVTLHPGQLVTSRKSIAKHFKISPSKVDRTLCFFEKEHQIEQRCNTQNRVISILQWDDYQTSEPRVSNECAASEPPVNTNKNERKKKQKTLPPIPPVGAVDARFERFWKAYPKKVGKGYARKCWDKLKPGNALTGKMLSALETAKRSPQWKRDGGLYIPLPSTWLNQGRWEDEYEITADGGPSEVETKEAKALRLLAEKRAAREKVLSARLQSLRKESEAFLENEKKLRLCASRAARSQGDAREKADQERLDLLLLRAEILRSQNKPPDWLEDRPDCPLCGDRGYIGTQKCECLLRMLGG